MAKSFTELSPQRQRVALLYMIINDYDNRKLITQEVDSLVCALYGNTPSKPQDRTRLENYKQKLGDFIVEE
jgi:hypothetical protein